MRLTNARFWGLSLAFWGIVALIIVIVATHRVSSSHSAATSQTDSYGWTAAEVANAQAFCRAANHPQAFCTCALRELASLRPVFLARYGPQDWVDQLWNDPTEQAVLKERCG